MYYTIAGISNDMSRVEGGPVDMGTAVYAVVCVNASMAVHMYKSTDGCQTWAEMDAANAPLRGGNLSYVRTSSLGTKIWISISGVDSVSDIEVVQFDTVTDTWGVRSSGGPSEYLAGSHSTVPRSDNTVVVAYTGPQERRSGVWYNRCRFSVWNNTSRTWTVLDTMLVGGVSFNIEFKGLIAGGSDLAHVIYVNSQDATLLRSKAVLTNNTLAAEQTCSWGTRTGGNTRVYGVRFNDGAAKIMLFGPLRTGERPAYTVGADTQTPAWGVPVAVGDTTSLTTAYCNDIAASASKISLFWQNKGAGSDYTKYFKTTPVASPLAFGADKVAELPLLLVQYCGLAYLSQINLMGLLSIGPEAPFGPIIYLVDPYWPVSLESQKGTMVSAPRINTQTTMVRRLDR